MPKPSFETSAETEPPSEPGRLHESPIPDVRSTAAADHSSEEPIAAGVPTHRPPHHPSRPRHAVASASDRSIRSALQRRPKLAVAVASNFLAAFAALIWLMTKTDDRKIYDDLTAIFAEFQTKRSMHATDADWTEFNRRIGEHTRPMIRHLE
jgi:hypothetical protein